jgi:hypothetical protein
MNTIGGDVYKPSTKQSIYLKRISRSYWKPSSNFSVGANIGV